MRRSVLVVIALALASAAGAAGRRLQSADYRRLRAVGDVRLSPDGARVAYSVITHDAAGRPGRELFVMSLSDGRSVRLGGEETASSPEWSPKESSRPKRPTRPRGCAPS